ncbi:hypothetical protein QBC40DRAFT_313467 [Triangularia verruculosa]|uniref:Uncharacterized protein n=1 Tax=Triangularia verruculosa TaxID=2587418 RepID=A0AAN6XP74_9PEZI|nr:hypothetical protein QBC40DRAFT_313467 [Triangularia verruculosa]
MEHARADPCRHTSKRQMMQQHAWRSSDTQGIMLPLSMQTRPSNESPRDKPPSSPRTPMPKSLDDQIYELKQYYNLTGQLYSWYVAGLRKIQQSRQVDGWQHMLSMHLPPAEAEIYKIQRLKSRICASFHHLSMIRAQQGSNNEKSARTMVPLKLTDLLQRDWDAPHLDRKTIHQLLMTSGYKPKSKSRFSLGLELKPSDADFFELCDAIEQQIKDLANRPAAASTLSPPPPSQVKVNVTKYSLFGPIAPPRSAAVPKQSENTTVAEQIPPIAKNQPAADPKTTAIPSTPPVKPVPPSHEIYKASKSHDQRSLSRLSQLAEAQLCQPENEVKPVIDLEGKKSVMRMPGAAPESVKVKRQHSSPTTEDVSEASMLSRAELTTKPKPGLSKLRHELQPETHEVHGLQAETSKAPVHGDPLPHATADLQASVFVSDPELQVKSKAELKFPKPAPPSESLRSAVRAQLRAQIEAKIRVPVYRNGEHQLEATKQASGQAQVENPTRDPMRSTIKSPVEVPCDTGLEPDWEYFPGPSAPTAFCEHCGIEHEDFKNLVWDEESDVDSGIELEDENGQEGGLLISRRHGQVIQEKDDEREVNIKGQNFLAKLNKVVKQSLEDQDLIAEWDEDFSEEPGMKEDGEYCIL